MNGFVVGVVLLCFTTKVPDPSQCSLKTASSWFYLRDACVPLPEGSVRWGEKRASYTRKVCFDHTNETME